jgi:hypothetical protein
MTFINLKNLIEKFISEELQSINRIQTLLRNEYLIF